MSSLNRDQVLAHLKLLPSLPAAIADLLASFSNEDVDVSRIAQQIAHDQGLMARVLRVANSSFYGLQHKVGTINEAVVVLGFRAVRSMVLAVGINGLFRVDQCRGFDAPSYLRHCVAVGVGARALATETGYNPELACTSGVLHDVGELVLAANFSERYAEVLAYRKEHDCFLLVAERDILGMDHCEVGSLLAETWRFPPVLQAAVAQHHAPASAETGLLADLMHVADAIALGLGYGHAAEEMVMPIERSSWQRLGLDTVKVGRVLPQIVAGVDETCQALSG